MPCPFSPSKEIGSATVGATPVNSCTFAASRSFSQGSRGTPAWAKTLNRVPEFPYAHDGVSIFCAVSAAFTADRSCMTTSERYLNRFREPSRIDATTSRCRCGHLGNVCENLVILGPAP
jgi:hypothetical protein